MTRIWMTGLETGHIGVFVTTDSASISTVQKRTGNYSVALTAVASQNAHADITLPANVAEIYMRTGVYITGARASSVLGFRDSASGYQLTLTITVGGLLELRIGRDDGAILGTAIHALGVGAWYCVEVHLLVDNTNGIGEVKLDGVLEIDFDGDTQNTANANIRYISLGSTRPSGLVNAINGSYDDIAINDVAGSYNNSWIGRGGIYPCFPSGIGEYSQLTPSAGDNYTCVDEKPPDDDTTYVSSADIDDQDSYEMDDLVPTAGTITAVQFLARARLTEAGAGNVARLFRIGGVDYQGANLPIDTTTYKFCNEILETSPVAPGTTQFSIAEVNGMQVGPVVE